MATRIRDMADTAGRTAVQLAKRIAITPKPDSPPGLIEALTLDPWAKSGKYGLGWTYFALALMGTVLLVRMWHFWQDKIRQAIYKQEVEEYYANLYNTDPDYAHAVHTGQAQHFFPDSDGLGEKQFKPRAHFSSVGFVNDTLALFRWMFYRPIPDLAWGSHRFTFSSLAVITCGLVALAFVALYCFLQQPLYWQSIQFGSPPVAIRAGMIAVALTPWIIVTSMKANVLSMLIGIGPERLNVFHRWAGYLCLFLSLVHMIPFYIQPVWDDGGMDVFSRLFPGGSGVIYGTGIACLVPLVWLCVASLPFIRRIAYELFVMLHVPVGMAYVGLLFWHTKNYLASWNYLWATVGIWAFCYFIRLFNLNWTRPWRLSFMVGDEAAISLLAENAIKVTIPTQMRWRPGQYVYLRMPGVSFFDNHPFTISSLCSDDFPSEYGEQYRDCILVFKPYGGFTRKVLDMAIEKGPFHTYRAFLDGPYGGMRRDLAAFDTCILIAGGSGITALMSQLLNLIKRMRDGKAITRKVVVVWSLKKLEAMDWFREELRICRESAPPESVTCKFFVTSAVRNRGMAIEGADRGAPRALSHLFHDKLDGFVAGIASKRNSALIQSVAQGDVDREQELRAEQEDRITALPQQKYLQPHQYPPPPPGPPPSSRYSAHEQSLRNLEGRDYDDEDRDAKKREFHFPPINTKGEVPHFNYAPASPRKVPETSPQDSDVPVRPPELAHLRTTNLPGAGQPRPTSTFGPPSGFDFGFPETPTEFQKSLMRFAFPVPHQIDGGWSVEYGRPDLGYMLKEWATGGADGRGILGRRTAVFVCGPPAMRVGVANTVARLQAAIWGDDMLEEIYLHTENYAL
ncbi:ferric reductase like transmembrane component [Colletotrichum graminicola]|uniref:ferric-chelate reductase (NADPH) n=1 Tax=Colletotrichum graminicola (strain M1.001 / M2 / FGSC 10212) TaxID=645133 RepID=E3QPD8_COLGM|nr:ferric reductase like transmembrane component [Colletotrichum graminicola M1.001]EFQ32726.1 ferric reductase like transmembrane component [Colletotrichum graminicola M1.001]WDK18051.1 ferric reductase like transmembrane component [Colletotrichum graminicola]